MDGIEHEKAEVAAFGGEADIAGDEVMVESTRERPGKKDEDRELSS